MTCVHTASRVVLSAGGRLRRHGGLVAYLSTAAVQVDVAAIAGGVYHQDHLAQVFAWIVWINRWSKYAAKEPSDLMICPGRIIVIRNINRLMHNSQTICPGQSTSY